MDPMSMACGGWIAAAVANAARLGIADLLADGPRCTAELADVTDTSEPVLRRVLLVLAALGVFRQTPDGRFENTDDSQRLRTDHPRSVRHFCQLAAGEYGRSFTELGHTLRTGRPAFHQVFGGSVYDYMRRAPAAAAIYDRAMAELARPVGAALAANRSFAGMRKLVDVGGGSGALSEALVTKHPDLTATVVDVPEVCSRATEQLATLPRSVADRITFVPGDFFDGLPSGGDVYLLKNVLHNWNDGSALRILQRVRAAMAGRAHVRLLVIEPLIGQGQPSIHTAMDDLMQVVICEPGTTMRTEPALRGLLEEAMLVVVDVERLSTGHSVIEGAIGGL
jgi:C-methyltransferase